MYLISDLINRTFAIIVTALILATVITIIFNIVHKFFHLNKHTSTIIFFVKIFLLLIYSLAIFLVLFPSWSINAIDGVDFLPLNLRPFKGIIQDVQMGNYVPIIGNVLIFMPLPIVISLFIRSLKGVIWTSILITILIEPLQLLINIITKFPNNVIDIDDLILNLIGCILGIFVSVLISICKVDKPSRGSFFALESRHKKNKRFYIN